MKTLRILSYLSISVLIQLMIVPSAFSISVDPGQVSRQHSMQSQYNKQQIQKHYKHQRTPKVIYKKKNPQTNRY